MIHVDRGPQTVPFAHRVTLGVSDDDALSARSLRRRVMALLAEQPRSLLCDLGTLGIVSADLDEVFRAVARHQREWAGTPVGVASPDPLFRRRLEDEPETPRFVVGESVPVVASRLAGIPAAEHATMTLEPGLTAPRSARAFVARACLRWQVRSVIGHACLVTSELVTNAVLHADTPVRVTVSRCPGSLRVAVQDGDEARPATTWAAVSETTLSASGRGLLLVSSVCRAWGVYPTEDDGKVVWAVLDDTSTAGSVSSRTSPYSRA